MRRPFFLFSSLTFCSAKQLTAKHSFSWAGNFMSTPLHSQCLLYVHVYVLVNSVALTYPWGSCTFLFLNFYSSSLKSYFLSFNSCFSTSIQDSSLKSYFLSFRSCFLFLNFYSSSLKSYFLSFNSCFSTSIQDSSLKSYFLSFRSCFLFLNFYSSSLKSYFLWFRSSFLFLNFYLFGFGSYFP